MAHVGFVRRVGQSLGLAIVALGGCGDDPSGLASATPEASLTGDGCSTSMAVGSDAPKPDTVAEPTAEEGVVAWTVRTEGGFDVQALATAGDLAFVGARTTVSALAMADGAQRWQQVVDVGDLTANTEPGEGPWTFVHQLAVGEVVAVAASERTITSHRDSSEIHHHSVVIALDATTGEQRWVSEVFEGGPAPAHWGAPLRVIDDVVVVEVESDRNHMVWAFDAATGAPRWRTDGEFAGEGNGAVFVYRRETCLVHAVGLADGVEKWSLATGEPSAAVRGVPIQVVPEGDDVIVVSDHVDAPVVVARVDPSTGADVWRVQFSSSDDVDAVFDGSRMRLAIERWRGDANSTLISVFELDPRSGEARWALEIPQSGLDPAAEIEDMLAANPFSRDTELVLVPTDSTISLSTGPELYELSLDGTVSRMVDVEQTLANLVIDPSRELVMRSITHPEGVVVSAGDTIALIH